MKKPIKLSIVLITFLLSFQADIFETSRFSDVSKLERFNNVQRFNPGDFTDGIIFPSRPGNPPNYSSQLNMNNYFSNLKSNFPENHYNSCGYTALSMVLSYYDTFYNDNIIPESYEVHFSASSNNINYSSPGLKHNSDTYPYGNHTLTEYVNNTYNERFDSYLMRLWQGPNATNYVGGTSISDRATILYNYYLQYGLNPILESGSIPNNNATYYGFSYGDIVTENMDQQGVGFYDWLVSQTETKSNETMLAAINYIHQGTPVILSIFQNYVINENFGIEGTDWKNNYYLFEGNHAVVAYDTTFVGDVEIPICHFGWGSSSVSVPYYYSGFNYIYGALPIESLSSHFHSNNYEIDGLLFCGCGHHTHTFSKEYVNDLKHSITCGCGYLNYENHSDYLYYSCCGGGLNYPPGVLSHEDDE